jgi:hypothetical protein
MNALLPHLRDEAPVLSTWNPLSPPDPRHVVSETVFERPLMTLESDATHEVRLSVCLSGRTDGHGASRCGASRSEAGTEWSTWQGQNRRFFVGAYAGAGIPLLEGCVESGLRVAKRFGVDEALIYRLPQVRVCPFCIRPAPDTTGVCVCVSLCVCVCVRWEGGQTDEPKDERFGAVPQSALVQADNPWRTALWVRALFFVRWSLRHLLDVLF